MLGGFLHYNNIHENRNKRYNIMLSIFQRVCLAFFSAVFTCRRQWSVLAPRGVVLAAVGINFLYELPVLLFHRSESIWWVHGRIPRLTMPHNPFQSSLSVCPPNIYKYRSVNTRHKDFLSLGFGALQQRKINVNSANVPVQQANWSRTG